MVAQQAQQVGQLGSANMNSERPKRPAPAVPVEPSKRQQAAEDTFGKSEEEPPAASSGKIRLVKLRQNEKDSKLGFSLRGGKEAATGCSVGVFVCHVERQSEAHRKGLKIGDRLIEVNGLRVSQASYEQVIGLIKRGAGRDDIQLLVAQTGRIPFQERTGEPIRWLAVAAVEEEEEEEEEEVEPADDEHQRSLGKELLLSEEPQPDEGMASYESKCSSSSSASSSSSLGPANRPADTATDSALSSQLSAASSCSISVSSLPSSTASGHSGGAQPDLVEVKVPGGRLAAEPFGCGVVKGPQEWPGIFVQTVRAGGLAERAQLEPGDQLVEADRRPLDQMPFDEAIGLIKRLQQEQDWLVLLVRKGAALKHLAAGLCCAKTIAAAKTVTAAVAAAAEPVERAAQPMASQWSGKQLHLVDSNENPISADGTQSQLSGTSQSPEAGEEPQVAATGGRRQKWTSGTLSAAPGRLIERKGAAPAHRQTTAKSNSVAQTKRLLLERLDEELDQLGPQTRPMATKSAGKRADELEDGHQDREEDEDEKEEIRIVSQNCKLHHYQSSQFHSKSHLELLEHKFPQLAVAAAAHQHQRRPLAPRQRPPQHLHQHQQQHRYLSTDNLSLVSQQQLLQLRRAHRNSAASSASRGRPQQRPAADCCPAQVYRRSSSVLGQPLAQCCQPRSCCRPAPRRLQSGARCQLLAAPQQQQRARSVDRLNMSISLNYLSITGQKQYRPAPRAMLADCCSLRPSPESCCCGPSAVAAACCRPSACCCRRLTTVQQQGQTAATLRPAVSAAYCAACCQSPVLVVARPPRRLGDGATTDSSGYVSAGERRPRRVQPTLHQHQHQHRQPPTPTPTPMVSSGATSAAGNRQRGLQLSTFGQQQQQQHPPRAFNAAKPPTVGACCPADLAPTSSASPPSSPFSASSGSGSPYSLAPSPESGGLRRATPPPASRAAPPPCPPPPPAPEAEGGPRHHRKEQKTVRERLCFVDELKMLAGTGEGGGGGGGRRQDSATLIKIINAGKAQAKQQPGAGQCSCGAHQLHQQHLCGGGAVASTAKSHHLAGGGKSVKTTSKLDDEDSKRRQHEMLMKEFKSAHSKMFKRRNNMESQEPNGGRQSSPEEVRLMRSSLMNKAKPSGFMESSLHLAAAN